MTERRLRFEAQALPHLDAALNLARWLVKSPADADDVVQEAMLRAFRAFDDVRGGDVKPWLLAIVRNCCMTLVAKRRDSRVIPFPTTDEVDEIADHAPSPETSAIAADQREKLTKALETLPEEFRTAIILREWEDLSYQQIAEVMEVPIGTVMSRLSRAREMLKTAWSNQVRSGAANGVR